MVQPPVGLLNVAEETGIQKNTDLAMICRHASSLGDGVGEGEDRSRYAARNIPYLRTESADGIVPWTNRPPRN